jgi:hypothetical protein
VTRGERTVNGVILHEVLAYRWDLYMISTDSRRTWESGIGYWTVAYLDSGTLTASHVDRALSLADALTIARTHREQRRDAEHAARQEGPS